MARADHQMHIDEHLAKAGEGTPKKQKTVYLIDASSFLYRAYYALKPLHTPAGTPVNAVYGFCRMVKSFFDRFNPHYCAVVWDSPGKTVRAKLYAEYKATRQAQPSDFVAQKELVKQFVDIIGVKQVAKDAVEADDLIISLARDFAAQDIRVIIVTTDKDMSQAVSPQIELFDPFKEVLRDVVAVERDYGFPIAKIPFYYALIGDTSDNIPGVRGVGDKTATTLVGQFESLDDLYAHLDRVASARTRDLLTVGRENAYLSQQLFTALPQEVENTIEKFSVDTRQFAAARSFFEKLNFSSLLKRLPGGEAAAQRAGGFAEAYGYTFTTVTDVETLTELCQIIKKVGACALDTETDGVRPLQSRLVGLSLCCRAGESYYIPLLHETGEKQLDSAAAIGTLRTILEDASIKKYLHNAKFDMLVLHHAGIELAGLAFDTMVAAGLLREDGEQIGLKALSKAYFKEIMTSYKQVVTDRKRREYYQVPLAEATDYAAADAHQTWRLVEPIQNDLRGAAEYKLYEEIEHPLVTVLYEMEREGIDVDPTVLDKVDKTVTHRLQHLVSQILDLVGMKGEELNLNSPQQVSDLLFQRLKLEPVKKTAGKTGYSTDIDVLQELAKKHPVPGLIIKYRELFKLKSTYIDALKAVINPETGRIHTTFKQTSVATGRLASADPNLQNIPAEAEEGLSIRAAFHAPRGCRLISADYSQIELRVLAYLSQDKALVKAFKEGEDIHLRTAAALFSVPLGDVTHEQRQVAKRINFSILYGMTPFGLAKDLDISRGDAKTYIDRYMAQYPGVQAWMEQVIAETTEHGYVTTLWGRRRHIPGIYEKNQVLYHLARRVAINTKAQGTAADLMKLGMVGLAHALHKRFPEARLLLQIHDELIVSAPAAQADDVGLLMAELLQQVVDWNVPLVVTVRHGRTWQEVSK
ncbi:MAG: DNA polymerase I [Candidatus Dependentiae bacterium]|nr:DNA polymerase I [Candidatus Dependentiae bacterium]